MNRYSDIEIVDGAVDFRLMNRKMVKAIVGDAGESAVFQGDLRLGRIQYGMDRIRERETDRRRK